MDILGDMKKNDFLVVYSQKGTINKILGSNNRNKQILILKEAMKLGMLPRRLDIINNPDNFHLGLKTRIDVIL